MHRDLAGFAFTEADVDELLVRKLHSGQFTQEAHNAVFIGGPGTRQGASGHGRLAAVRKLGLNAVPVIELSHLSPNQKRAYVISDNRLALDSGWDEEMLALKLAELTEAGFDLALTGFDDEVSAHSFGRQHRVQAFSVKALSIDEQAA